MKNIKYTFLLPAYKAKFFAEALESIKNQTYKDFACVVSDDCSPEDLKSIYDEVIGNDPRFSFRRNNENMGGKSLVTHWNLLVDMCNTEYFIMASDDDVYDSVFLEVVDSLFHRYPEVNLLRGRTRCIGPNGKTTVEERFIPEKLDITHFIYCMFFEGGLGGIGGFVYKTRNLKDNGKFVDFPLAWFSDYATNILMADCGCCFTDRIIFSVRYSDVQISSRWGDPDDSKNKISATLMFYNWLTKFMDNNHDKMDLSLLNRVKYEYKDTITSNIYSHLYNCHSIDFFKFLIRIPSDLKVNKLRMLAHYLRNKLCL